MTYKTLSKETRGKRRWGKGWIAVQESVATVCHTALTPRSKIYGPSRSVFRPSLPPSLRNQRIAFGGQRFHDMEDELGSHQNQSEKRGDTRPTFGHGDFRHRNPVLIKVVAVFDASAQAPVIVDFPSEGFVQDAVL